MHAWFARAANPHDRPLPALLVYGEVASGKTTRVARTAADAHVDCLWLGADDDDLGNATGRRQWLARTQSRQRTPRVLVADDVDVVFTSKGASGMSWTAIQAFASGAMPVVFIVSDPYSVPAFRGKLEDEKLFPPHALVRVKCTRPRPDVALAVLRTESPGADDALLRRLVAEHACDLRAARAALALESRTPLAPASVPLHVRLDQWTTLRALLGIGGMPPLEPGARATLVGAHRGFLERQVRAYLYTGVSTATCAFTRTDARALVATAPSPTATRADVELEDALAAAEALVFVDTLPIVLAARTDYSIEYLADVARHARTHARTLPSPLARTPYPAPGAQAVGVLGRALLTRRLPTSTAAPTPITWLPRTAAYTLVRGATLDERAYAAALVGDSVAAGRLMSFDAWAKTEAARLPPAATTTRKRVKPAKLKADAFSVKSRRLSLCSVVACRRACADQA